MKTTDDFINGPDVVDVLTNLTPFLKYAAEDGVMYGGVDAVEALDSFRDLLYILGYERDKIDRMIAAM